MISNKNTARLLFTSFLYIVILRVACCHGNFTNALTTRGGRVVEPEKAGRFDCPVVKMGCFNYWGGSVWQGRESPPRLFITPELCMSYCENKYKNGTVKSDIAMIKGIYCMCTYSSSFIKPKLDDKYCDYKCRDGGSCGGNIGVSVYYRPLLGDRKVCTPNLELEFEYDPEMDFANFPDEVRSASFPINEIENPPHICAKCTRTDSQNKEELDCFIKGDVGNDVNGRDKDYFPLNSPQACIDYCRTNPVPSNFKPIAILQWKSIMVYDDLELTSTKSSNKTHKVAYFEYGLPICRCEKQDPLKYQNWELAPPQECRTSCPGPNPGPGLEPDPEICGTFDTSHGTFSFVSVYCAFEGEECNSLLGITPTTTTPAPPPTTTTEEGSTSTSPATTTDIPTSTSTSKTTTEPIYDSTELTASTESSSSFSIVYGSSSSSSSSPGQISSTTEMAEKCDAPCRAVDTYGWNWVGCPLQTVQRNCNEGVGNLHKIGVMKWKCLPSGKFEGDSPDYSNCSSVWIGDLWGEFENYTQNNQNLNRDLSMALLTDMESKSRISNSNKIPYYGHEIQRIASLSSSIINKSESTLSLSDRRDLVSKGSDVAGILLVNKQPWQELNASSISSVGLEILQSIELNMFTFSETPTGDSGGEEELIVSQIGTADLRRSEFQSTFGRSPPNSTREPLTFPLGATESSSFIQLSEGWENLVESPEFVGISLDSRFIQNLFPSQLIQNKTTGLNGRFLCLSLRGLGNENGNINGNVSGKHSKTDLNNLRGGKATIKFQHESDAFGTPHCVFWHVDKMEWATDGCKMIETTKTYTICECTHLTSFALLMDTDELHSLADNFALEILTLIICPVSVVCLLGSFVVFSSTTSKMRGRNTKEKISITKHLTLCLLIGTCLLLLVVDRGYFNLPDAFCTAVGMMTHFSFLSAFAWMQIEGIHVYRMIVVVFESERSFSTFYAIGAYGISVFVVAVTSIVGNLKDHRQPYGGEDYCWLEGRYIWSFMGPVAFVILTNSALLILAYKTAFKMKATTAFLRQKQGNYATWIRGSFSLTIILGITWLPGFLMMTESKAVSYIAAYLFVILNASQGIFIFIFHCWMNATVWSKARQNLSNLLPSSFEFELGASKGSQLKNSSTNCATEQSKTSEANGIQSPKWKEDDSKLKPLARKKKVSSSKSLTLSRSDSGIYHSLEEIYME